MLGRCCPHCDLALTTDEIGAGVCPGCNRPLPATPTEKRNRRRSGDVLKADPAAEAAAWNTVRLGLLMILIGESIQAAATVSLGLLFQYWTADGQPRPFDVDTMPNPFIMGVAAFAVLAPLLVNIAVWVFGMIRCFKAPRAKGWMIATLCCWALLIAVPTCLRPYPRDAQAAFHGLLFLYAACFTVFLSMVSWHFTDRAHALACWLFLLIFTIWWFLPTILSRIGEDQRHEYLDLYQSYLLFFAVVYFVIHAALVVAVRRVIGLKVNQQLT
ncbi:MAG: hypothetical protein HY289_07425 [Planctomycetes bacterium]|nr:hypothetical protein [Planctomycetota bacterium]